MQSWAVSLLTSMLGHKQLNWDHEVWDEYESSDPDLLARIEMICYQGGCCWECCDQDDSTEGCIVSRHEPREDVGRKKTRRILTPVSRNTVADSSFRGPGGRQVL